MFHWWTHFKFHCTKDTSTNILTTSNKTKTFNDLMKSKWELSGSIECTLTISQKDRRKHKTNIDSSLTHGCVKSPEWERPASNTTCFILASSQKHHHSWSSLKHHVPNTVYASVYRCFQQQQLCGTIMQLLLYYAIKYEYKSNCYIIIKHRADGNFKARCMHLMNVYSESRTIEQFLGLVDKWQHYYKNIHPTTAYF